MNKLFLLTAIFGLTIIFGCNDNNKQNQANMKSNNKIEFINPEGLHKNPAFSQMVTTEGNYKTVYVGGQNAVDKNGKIVGKGDIDAQSKQILSNIETALTAGGASFDNVIKWNVYVVNGQPIENAMKVFQGAMSKMKNPPLISMIYVAGLANPDFLMEMDAIAVVPEK